jgi:hypothetical protein
MKSRAETTRKSLMIAKILRVLSRGLIVTLNNHFIYTHREIPVLVLASEHSHPESTLIKYNRQNDKTPKMANCHDLSNVANTKN